MTNKRRFLRTCTLAAGGLLGLTARVASAAVITVDDTNDELNGDGSCSLREAVESANTDAAVDGCVAGSGADEVVLPPGTFLLTIAGSYDDENQSGDIDLRSDITLRGAGVDQTVIESATDDRVLEALCSDIDGYDYSCVEDTTITISGVTLYNGYAGAGGGLRVSGEAGRQAQYPIVVLEDSRVTGNFATDGGGVRGEGNLTIRNTLIDNNAAQTYGGGLQAFGVVTVEDSEFLNNSSGYDGGGIANNAVMTVKRSLLNGNVAVSTGGGFSGINDQSTLTNLTVVNNSADFGAGIACGNAYNACGIELSHSTVWGNYANVGAGGVETLGGQNSQALLTLSNNIVSGNGVDAVGTFQSAGFNLITAPDVGVAGFVTTDIIGVDPELLSLMDNGGSTATMELEPTSPAIDAGTCVTPGGMPVDEDQRGEPRPVGASCDMGSFELAGEGCAEDICAGAPLSLRVLTPGYADRYARHAYGLGYTEVVTEFSSELLKSDASWVAVEGLADPGCFSFESVNYPGHYLRHAYYRLRLDANDSSSLFAADATFCPQAALDGSGGVSLESSNFPNHFVRHRYAELWLDPFTETTLFRHDSSWAVEGSFALPASP